MINIGYKKIEAVGDKVDEIKDTITEESEKGIQNYFDSQTTEILNDALTVQASMDNQAETQTDLCNLLWGSIWAAFEGSDILGYDLNTQDFMNNPDRRGKDFQAIFTVFGYSLVLVFFAVSLIDQTVKYEIFTLRGAAMIFGRLIISKTVIDASGWVCLSIISISENMCSKLMALTAETAILTNAPHIKVETSGIFIVGPVVDYLIANMISLPVSLIFLVVIIAGGLILVKLLLRSFELTMLTVVSPAFFACASSQSTMQYFKNFIGTFLQAAFQIVFMAVVYFVGVEHLSFQTADITSFAELGAWLLKALPNTILIIAMAIMMVKPPRVLTGLMK